MTTTTNSVTPIIKPIVGTGLVEPEFLQAIDDTFDIVAQTYDIKNPDNQDVFILFRQTLIEQFSHIKQHVQVKAVVGKGRNKKVAYSLYISSRFSENKKKPEPNMASTNLMTKFSKE